MMFRQSSLVHPFQNLVLGDEEGYRAYFADFGEHALPMKLGSITCPTLVVHGEHDPVPVASSSAIADAIPQGELAVVDGANHYGILESPETVLAVVEPFLAAHAS